MDSCFATFNLESNSSKIKKVYAEITLFHEGMRLCITKTCPCNIQRIFWLWKKKNVKIFLNFAQNIDCGYTLEPPRRGGSNEYPHSMFWSKNKKNRYTPAYSSFTYIKLGFKGVFIARTCFPEGSAHALRLEILRLKLDELITKTHLHVYALNGDLLH